MTTLWARMLVIKAWEKGEITEECAHYFDELLFKNSFIQVFTDGGIDTRELTSFNQHYTTRSVLKNIGGGELFDVLTYIKRTSFEKGYTIGNNTVYLANIIKEDYESLGLSVKSQFGVPLFSAQLEEFGKEWYQEDNLESLVKIYNYLKNTNYKNYQLVCNLEYGIKKIKTAQQGKNIKEEKAKTYDKPAYTDLIDADY